MVSDNYNLLPEDNSTENGGTTGGELDLKAIRESKGLTLQDIYRVTRISVVNLDAIENNDLHLLPAPVYTKTFIKTYAMALGVDSKDILERYAKHLVSLDAAAPEKPAEKPAMKMRIPLPVLVWSLAVLIFCSLVFLSLALHDKTEVDVGAPVRPKQTAKIPTDEGRPAGASKEIPSADGTQAAPQPETPPALAQKAVLPPAPAQQKATVPAQPAVLAPTVAGGSDSRPKTVASASPYRLSITAKELTWLKIVSDQKPPYEIMLKPGERLDRSATEQFLLDIGNAGGIDAEFQGNPLGSLGKSGEVVHLKLPQ